MRLEVMQGSLEEVVQGMNNELPLLRSAVERLAVRKLFHSIK